MAQSPETKQQIAAAISANRVELQNGALLVRHNLDLRNFGRNRGKRLIHLDECRGHFRLDLIEATRAEFKIPVLSSDPDRCQKIEWRRSAETRPGRRVVDRENRFRRLSDQEDFENGANPRSRFPLRSLDLGQRILKALWAKQGKK